MAEQTDIPVCTLFQENAADSNVNAGDFLQDSKPIEDTTEKAKNPEISENTTPKEEKQSPGVCNLFQDDSSDIDLFSSLAITDQSFMAEPSTRSDATEASVGNLVQNETNFGMEDKPTVIDANNAEESLEQNDTMASILINDSFENISNISFDQSHTEPEAATNLITTTADITPQMSLENDVKTEASNTPVVGQDQNNLITATTDKIQPTFLENDVKTKASNTPVMKQDENKNMDFENKEKPEVSTVQDVDTIEKPAEPARIESTEQTTSDVNTTLASALFSNLDYSSPFDRIRKPSEDAFTSALTNSEADRRRDAWIPSDSTSAVLSAILTSQKRIKLEPTHLTRPGLATSESLGDPIKAVLARHGATDIANQRQRNTADSVSQDKDGLMELVTSGDLRAAVDLCGKILTDLGQGFGQATQPSENSPVSLQWWHARLSLLIRLKLYELSETEINQFGDFDKADLYFGFYPDLYPGKRGSMVPFSMRVLHAQFPLHNNKPDEALGRLYALQDTCKKILHNLNCGKTEDGSVGELKSEDRESSIKLWRERSKSLFYCIGNALLQNREYEAAIKTYDHILTSNGGDAVYLQSGIGRALLQLGSIKSAQHRFTKAEQAANDDPKYKSQLLMNRAFLYLGASNWKEALVQFNEVLKLDPQNLEALNNKSVCLLYLCRLKDAITSLETAVWMQSNENAKDFVKNQLPFEGALSNLVTLYELESSRFMSKKQSLLHHIANISGDGFDVTCLKM
ncbi:trafficking protein particle complex subunit 12-like [Ciona intestinalis]